MVMHTVVKRENGSSSRTSEKTIKNESRRKEHDAFLGWEM